MVKLRQIGPAGRFVGEYVEQVIIAFEIVPGLGLADDGLAEQVCGERETGFAHLAEAAALLLFAPGHDAGGES